MLIGILPRLVFASAAFAPAPLLAGQSFIYFVACSVWPVEEEATEGTPKETPGVVRVFFGVVPLFPPGPHPPGRTDVPLTW